MFKIKDDVDLKELEKFDFYLDQSLDNGQYYYTNGVLFIDNRVIKQMDQYNPFSEVDYEFDSYYLEVFYKLTKAGLVESVELEGDR